MSKQPKLLVLGLGSTLQTDCGVGIYTARRIKEMVQPDIVSVRESDLSGLNIPGLIDGFDDVIIIDCVETDFGIPGNIYRYNLSEMDGERGYPASIHADIDILANRNNINNIYIPERIILYAVETPNTQCFGKGCTEEIERIIPKLSKLIVDEINREFSIR